MGLPWLSSAPEAPDASPRSAVQAADGEKFVGVSVPREAPRPALVVKSNGRARIASASVNTRHSWHIQAVHSSAAGSSDPHTRHALGRDRTLSIISTIAHAPRFTCHGTTRNRTQGEARMIGSSGIGEQRESCFPIRSRAAPLLGAKAVAGARGNSWCSPSGTPDLPECPPCLGVSRAERRFLTQGASFVTVCRVRVWTDLDSPMDSSIR